MSTREAKAPAQETGPGRPVRPDVPGALARAAAATFHLLSRLRGARIVHPHGVCFAGILRVDPPSAGYPGVPLLERRDEHPALVRFSRGVGLPEPLPDVLGLTLRLPDVHGPGRHQDFLLASSVDAPLLRHLLFPSRRDPLKQAYSSVLAYRVGRSVRVVGARPANGSPARPRFQLTLASLTGRGVAVAELEVGERMADERNERLAFTPWNTGGGIRPAGPLMGLRRAAYRGSQAGRGLEPTEIP